MAYRSRMGDREERHVAEELVVDDEYALDQLLTSSLTATVVCSLLLTVFSPHFHVSFPPFMTESQAKLVRIFRPIQASSLSIL